MKLTKEVYNKKCYEEEFSIYPTFIQPLAEVMI